ncbi:type 1 glutamine amidotransferase [Haladaptatus caseinilyticus]|uniref:type 1 glutamine amidotransferase n=1 Tax=Haladaptatus caseinilyticus TaxID=2993314 RepID=UPI00224B9A09|nr:type 1 glutamine amidotransferase [Haladaptatus caseinilyticus]
MILVLDDEVQPEYRYLAPEIERLLPDAEYEIYVEDPFEPDLDEYEGIVISGSTASVYDDAEADWVDPQVELVRRCLREEVPLLGICFGHQLINRALGGRVTSDRRRATFVEMNQVATDPILEGVADHVPVLHADIVAERGDGMIATARTEYSENFCTRHESAPIWSVQFHPEFTERVVDRPDDWSSGEHTFEDITATEVLSNFATICDAV